MFSSRRKIAKRVARNDTEEHDIDQDSGPVVRKPNAAPKIKSKLRMSFDPGETSKEETIQVKQRLGPSTILQDLPRFNTEIERPSYSKSQLDELRGSTPSTPRDLSLLDPTSDLDITTKFGASTVSTASAIPSAAEIQEKKERRARLAKEQGAEDFIPLEDYDSDGEFKPQRMQVGSYTRPEKDTRLVQDDEDFAEGFEQFVDDPGRVAMGKKGLREQAKKEREAMKDMIEQAEGSEEDESDSDAERNYAYESAQTHHGMDGLAAHSEQKKAANRPRQPRDITAIPKLAVALERLREAAQKIELDKIQIERRVAAVRTERAEILASQNHIQQSLQEAGKELEALQISAGGQDDSVMVNRGLDSMGTEVTT